MCVEGEEGGHGGGYHSKHLLCVPGKLQYYLPFTNRNFRIVCIFMKEMLGLREVKKTPCH